MSAVEKVDWPVDEVNGRWVDVLQAIKDKKPYALAPWNPLTGETRVAFAAFRAYLDSTERVANQVAAQMLLEAATVRQWLRQWEWERRVECYDTWLVRNADDARAEQMSKITFDNTTAFAKLPKLVEMCSSLVEASLSDHVRKAELAAAQGRPAEPLPLAMALKVLEAQRALMAETNRFLGAKPTEINLNVSGKVVHEMEPPTKKDLSTFFQGLGDANIGGVRQAIEASAGEAEDVGTPE